MRHWAGINIMRKYRRNELDATAKSVDFMPVLRWYTKVGRSGGCNTRLGLTTTRYGASDMATNTLITVDFHGAKLIARRGAAP